MGALVYTAESALQPGDLLFRDDQPDGRWLEFVEYNAKGKATFLDHLGRRETFVRHSSILLGRTITEKAAA